MATKSPAGWIILVLVLAVPGVLFYHWYTHLDQAQKKALNMRVRIHDSGLFPSSNNKHKLVNPIAAAHQQDSAPAPKTAAAAASVAVSSVATVAAPQPAAAAVAFATQPAPGAPAVTPGGGALPTSATPATSPTLVVDPPAPSFLTWKDPTLSPYDHVRIKKMELDEQLRQQELRDAALHQKPKHQIKRTPPVEYSIDLQGIVSTAESGNRAIVNGEVVGPGDTLKTQAGPVKVLRITTQGVVFLHQNRKFSKTVSR